MFYRQSFFTRLALNLFIAVLALPLAAFAQEKKEVDQALDPMLTPIYVTVRVFDLSAKTDSYQPFTDQVFRLKTSGLSDEEKWQGAFKKTYPELSAALLQTEARRVFRTAKPAIINFGQLGGRTLQVQLFGAQSPGDGTTPGTSLVTDIGLHFGNDNTSPPITFSMQPLEVETGMTYYFASARAKLNAKDYADFIRKGAPATAFAEQDHYFLFALSVDLTKPQQSARSLNEQESSTLLVGATKKPQPELSAALKQAGLGGRVQVRVEIAPDGKVVKAVTHNSTLPEMNREAVAAARQWEFSPALFAEDKNPISGLLTFEFAAADAKPKEAKQPSSN